jgi:hypothetical protein
MRGQSMVEYVTTYGWAILALVIIIGLLVNSGALSPTFLVSEECSLGSNLACQFAIVNHDADTKISLGLYNGFPYKINVTDVQVYDPASGLSFGGFPKGTLVESGSNYSAEGSLGAELPAGTVMRLYANVTYEACTPEVAAPGSVCSDAQHTVSGKITGKIIAG